MITRESTRSATLLPTYWASWTSTKKGSPESNLGVQPVFDSGEPFFVEVHEAQYVGSKVALRVDSLVLLLKINPLQIEGLDRLFLVGRHLAGNPSEALCRRQFCFQHLARDPQHAGEQLRGQLNICDFNGYREHGIHRDAHCQGIQVAVVDGAALWRDVHDALLLPGRACEVLGVTDELQVA